MAKDCQDITVHAVSFVHRRGPVFYASLPCCHRNPQRICGRTGQGTSTASSPSCGITLWRWKVLFGNAVIPPTEPLSRFRWSAARLAGPISCWENIGVRPSPSARVEEKSGPPSVEMSPISASMWQGPMNSRREYPFHRVFHAQELQHALRLAGGDLEKASALLWSIKEAVVKALGCAFHLVDPRQINVYPRSAGRGRRRVYLSGGLIKEGPGAVSHSRRPVHMGTFASSGEDVAFHRPLESARSMRRWAAADWARFLINRSPKAGALARLLLRMGSGLGAVAGVPESGFFEGLGIFLLAEVQK